jgi:hypothetical protein
MIFYYRLKTQYIYIYQQLDNISKFWQNISAVKSHHQAKIEQSLGTKKVCILWDPISFTVVGIVTTVNYMGSHRVQTFIVPRLCSLWPDDGFLQPKNVVKILKYCQVADMYVVFLDGNKISLY